MFCKGTVICNLLHVIPCIRGTYKVKHLIFCFFYFLYFVVSIQIGNKKILTK